MRIIPAIDVLGGKCVRLQQGDYQKNKVYNENPLEVAKEFEANGIKYLHMVDLDGAKSKQIVNYKILEEVATHTNLKIDFGGGIKSNEDVKIAFESGAAQITGGSIAAKNPALFLEWLSIYGKEKIILGADCKNQKIATNAWLESTELNVIDFINEYVGKGIQSVICTDIAKDGMLQGPSFDLYEKILQNKKVNLIASGGIASMDDLVKLKAMGCEGAIVGKAIYEGRVEIGDLKFKI